MKPVEQKYTHKKMKALYNKITKEVFNWLDPTANAMGLGPDVAFIDLPDVSENDSKSITNLSDIAGFSLKECQGNRKTEYPKLEDQLDHIYHNGIDSWKTNIIKPIKDKYPKP